MGAKQERTKGNKQKAKYSESDGKHGKPGREKGEKPGKRERNRSTEEATYEAETGRKWKQRKAPKAKAKGDHLWNGCGSEAGKDERKQTES